MRRTQPLADVDSKQTAAIEEFNKKWEAGELEGWADVNQKTQVDGSGEGIWCAACKPFRNSLCVALYLFPRPKDVFKTNRLRCSSHLEKTYQIYLQASRV
jgi:hypothetical protein